MNKRLSDPAEEKQFQEMFPWRTLSPEEYAARESHLIGAFTLDRRRYSNGAFDQWISDLGSIFRDSQKVRECRKRFLTPAELADIDAYLDEIRRHPERF